MKIELGKMTKIYILMGYSLFANAHGMERAVVLIAVCSILVALFEKPS